MSLGKWAPRYTRESEMNAARASATPPTTRAARRDAGHAAGRATARNAATQKLPAA
jgi:hypothetical protein